MQITVSGHRFDVTEALKAYAENRVGKIARYFDHILTANVTLSTERNWHIAEVNIYGKDIDMRGQERSKDMYHSIDAVVEKLERQIKRQKGKAIDRNRGSSRPEAAERREPLEEATGGGGRPSRFAPRVEAERSFRAHPMSLEQAIKEMEALGHQFYAFHNAANGRINVVYKRDRGFGLIDPRLED